MQAVRPSSDNVDFTLANIKIEGRNWLFLQLDKEDVKKAIAISAAIHVLLLLISALALSLFAADLLPLRPELRLQIVDVDVHNGSDTAQGSIGYEGGENNQTESQKTVSALQQPVPQTPPPAETVKNNTKAESSIAANAKKGEKIRAPQKQDRTKEVKQKPLDVAAPTTPIPVQPVRPTAAEQPESVAMLNKAEAERITAHYEKVLASWINKNKIYPTSAKQQGQTGRAVLRVQIDRRGTILYSTLAESSGHALLDEAVITMADRANPVPAVPANYPKGEVLEFLIPVRFSLN